MKKFISFLLLALSLIACIPAFAADQVAAPSAATAVMATPAGPVVMPQAVVTAPQAVLPAWQPLPAQHDLGSILGWVTLFLIPWVMWFVDTLMPFLPGKAQGIVHGIVLMFKTPAYDPTTETVTLNLAQVKAIIAELKGLPAASATAADTAKGA